jgi:hypothetical protein
MRSTSTAHVQSAPRVKPIVTAGRTSPSPSVVTVFVTQQSTPTDPFQRSDSASTTSDGTDLAPLTAFDRCDSSDCSAQAFLRVRLRSGLELVFCGHHGHDLIPVLAGQGAVVRDDSPLLVEDRSRSWLG